MKKHIIELEIDDLRLVYDALKTHLSYLADLYTDTYKKFDSKTKIDLDEKSYYEQELNDIRQEFNRTEDLIKILE
jgi:hypothetical protein